MEQAPTVKWSRWGQPEMPWRTAASGERVAFGESGAM